MTRSHSVPLLYGFRDHLPPLDGVRGLAILMVIGSHAFYSNSANSGRLFRWMGDLLAYGLFGVDLFFVLSGFLITGLLIDSLDDSAFFRKFYARRALRIFPLYYGVLLALLLLTPVLHLQWHGMGWLMLGYLQNLQPNEVVTYSPGAGLALNHFWSLAIEEQFYLIWPAVVFFIRDRGRLLLATILISFFALVLRFILVGAGVGAHLIHVTTLTRADSLLLGGALSLLFRSEHWERVQQWARPGLVVSAAAVAISILLLPREFASNPEFSLAQRFWIDGLRYTVLAAGSACLIALSLRRGSACAWIFERDWLRFFGRYSYGIYVLHMIPLSILLRTQRTAILSLTHSKAIAVAGAGFLSLALAVMAAYICFHLYEKPFLRIKHHFDYAPKRMGPLSSARPVRRVALDLVNSESFKREVSLR